jgi:ABC-type transporter Mla MlaB component
MPHLRRQFVYHAIHIPDAGCPMPALRLPAGLLGREADGAILQRRTSRARGFDRSAEPAKDASPEFVLDLQGVQMLDSATLGKLISFHRKASMKGRRMALANVGPELRKALSITKLDKVLMILE